MMASSQNLSAKSSFGQTLQFITDIKLQELEKQRVLYQTHANVVKEAKAVGAKGDILKKVEILAKAIKSWTGSGALGCKMTVGGDLNLQDLEFWLQQARKDPSFSTDVAEGWAETLEQHIRHTTTRFDAAKLFGSLFNEWLASGDSIAIAYQDIDDSDGQTVNTDTEADFVEVGRKEMHEQKEKLQSIIFEEHLVDITELDAYLENLFASEEASTALDVLRLSLKRFSHSLQRKPITSGDVINAIKGLMASDGLMNEEKRATLKAFEQNPTILQEVASVLSMRIANLDSWEWPKGGILIEFRRHMNGKYRAFTDPEIVDALLLHHVGVSWQVQLKSSLSALFRGKAWLRLPQPSRDVQTHRSTLLSGDNGANSINHARDDMRGKNFFMSQLQTKMSMPTPYDDVIDVSNKDVLNPVVVKQKLLQIMTTECYLNTAVHGSHAAVCSDLEWFGPSLPHKSILTVFEFLGMPKEWLRFYTAFLSMPVRFPGDPEPRVRKCGTPIGYSLSVVCGEIVCFIMDFAVNQHANGLYLYRMHDDLWLWDSDVKKVASGWAEMKKYAAIVGLKFNEKKTGSAYIGPQNAASFALPAGDIRWGFLKFDAAQKRFRLDQDEVDQHIVEMRRQLTSTKSVFGWVNAYNKYMAFFFRNFGGTPAKCFGKEHVVELIDTLAHIQRELFPPSTENGTGGPVGYLRRTLEQRFGVTDLPEGYFYFPIGSGGLELRHIILELLALEQWGRPFTVCDDSKGHHHLTVQSAFDSDDESDYESAPDTPGPLELQSFQEDKFIADKKFVKRVEYDSKTYTQAKEHWEQNADTRYRSIRFDSKSQEFMSFEEYTSLRESWLQEWGRSYNDMLEAPRYIQVTPLPKLSAAADSQSKPWATMDWYEKWVISMYGAGVIKKYGGVKAVDPALIPVGMVELFRTSRMKLDQ